MTNEDSEGFYEDDEPPAKIRATFERGEKGVTKRPRDLNRIAASIVQEATAWAEPPEGPPRTHWAVGYHALVASTSSSGNVAIGMAATIVSPGDSIVTLPADWVLPTITDPVSAG